MSYVDCITLDGGMIRVPIERLILRPAAAGAADTHDRASNMVANQATFYLKALQKGNPYQSLCIHAMGSSPLVSLVN